MPRPKCCRWIGQAPNNTCFKPRGVPMSRLDEVVMTLDELEALRLSGLEGLYQGDAAARMHISRQTFGRIIDSAQRKVADALVHGKAIRIEGGTVDLSAVRQFECLDCRHRWRVRRGHARPSHCPACRSDDVQWHSTKRNDSSNQGVPS